MSLRRCVAALTAASAALAIAAPLASADPLPSLAAPATLPAPFAPDPNLCLTGVVDLGPFGPLGPYGPSGPYGPNGPLAGRPNPIGNAATCGGLLAFILRGGTLESYINASIGH